MKSLALILTSLVQPLRRRNTRVVIWLVAGLLVLIALYSVIFHEIMAYEDRSYSWATGIYWTLTVMSTLGFGDITFESDIGRIFSVIVLISGATFVLVLLPFVFIQFIFMPWMARRDANRTPRRLGPEFTGHVILTNIGPVAESLIRRLRAASLRYVVVVEEPSEALELSDRGFEVMVGPLDDPQTYENARAHDASLVVATQSDMTNTNIVFTVDELDPRVPTVATASSDAGVDVLHRAGCDTVLQLGRLLGGSMARRVIGRDGRARIIGAFGELMVAEASPAGTSIEGRSLSDSAIRESARVNVVGLWRRGRFRVPDAETVIDPTDVMILVGSKDQLSAYDDVFGAPAHGNGRVAPNTDEGRVIVVGGGRVGRAAAEVLGGAGLSCRIIERSGERIRNSELYVHGDASELDVLEKAGIGEASSMLITTHDDDVNIYLAIYCRQISPELQIIARSNRERNIASLNRAGADSVLSYASLGSTAILNSLGGNDSLVLAEGLEMFSMLTPRSLTGRSLAQLRLRDLTGCNVVAVIDEGVTVPNPDPTVALPGRSSLILIGDQESQRRFRERFPLVGVSEETGTKDRGRRR